MTSTVYFLAAVCIGLLLVDWLQTRYISKHPDLFEEGNVVLGSHPSLTMVNIYFGVCAILVVAAVYFLPSNRALVGAETILIVVEGFVVFNNYRKGIGL